MSTRDVRMIILNTDDLDASIQFYTEVLGMPLKFRDGSHFAAIDAGSVTLALTTSLDHPLPGQIVVAVRTDDVDRDAQAVEDGGGGIVKAPYDSQYERRAVAYDSMGNGLVFYSPIKR